MNTKKIKIYENNSNAVFEKYTVFDETIVKMAKHYQLYLIGGTAIDLLCNYYSVLPWRHRSNNDLDFWTSHDNTENIEAFSNHIISTMGFDTREHSDYMISLESLAIKTDVDILIDFDGGHKPFCDEVNDMGVMSPVYLFSSKFDRYLHSTNPQRRDTDFKDLQLLLKIIEKTDDFDRLEVHLANQNYDQKAERALNAIIVSAM